MAYMIDARLEQGAPSLTLYDAKTGIKRFHWRGNASGVNACDWQELFKRLALLSCADQLAMVRRNKSLGFGEECLSCEECIDQLPAQKTAGLDVRYGGNVVSMQEWRKS